MPHLGERTYLELEPSGAGSACSIKLIVCVEVTVFLVSW
jgi:hypothetical protein